MIGARDFADALKHSFDTGDRGPLEALCAPGCVNWHNSDKLEVPSVGFAGAGALRQIVDNLHANLVQVADFPLGGVVRFVIRGTVLSSGHDLDVHNCAVITIGEEGITRIDDYVDPTIMEQIVGPTP
jgi:hypothetical protein